MDPFAGYRRREPRCHRAQIRGCDTDQDAVSIASKRCRIAFAATRKKEHKIASPQ